MDLNVKKIIKIKIFYKTFDLLKKKRHNYIVSHNKIFICILSKFFALCTPFHYSDVFHLRPHYKCLNFRTVPGLMNPSPRKGRSWTNGLPGMPQCQHWRVWMFGLRTTTRKNGQNSRFLFLEWVCLEILNWWVTTFLWHNLT